SVPVVNGLATFSGLTLNQAGTGFTLKATSGNLAPVNTGSIAVTTSTTLTLSANTVAEFQPRGTVVGNFTTVEPTTGHTFTYNLVAGSGSTDNGSFTITTGGQ